MEFALSPGPVPACAVRGNHSCTWQSQGGARPAAGCGVAIVDDTTTAFLDLRGVLDPAKEVEKLVKKRADVRSKIIITLNVDDCINCVLSSYQNICGIFLRWTRPHPFALKDAQMCRTVTFFSCTIPR